MPRASSGGPIIYDSFVANTRSDFVTAVRALLLSAGWSSLGTVSGGYKLLGTSPQSTGAEILTTQVIIADTGHSGLFGGTQGTMQIVSDVTPHTVTSGEHYARCFGGAVYRLWANPCQFFIWRPGVFHDQEGSVIAGGVPWVASASPCHDIIPTEPCTEAWWIVSDVGGSPRAHPRITLAADGRSHGAFPPNYADACWNGSFHDRNTATAGWQILPIHSLANFNFASTFGLTLSHTRWWDGTGLQYEPIVTWGKAGDVAGSLRSQLWDSMIYSLPQTMDTIFVDPLNDMYVNFTDDYYWGALQLFLGNAGTVQANYTF